MLRKSIAIFIVIFIVFKVYLSSIIYTNISMWNLLWYCNLSWILLALGIYQKNQILNTVILTTSSIQLIWYFELVVFVFDIDIGLNRFSFLEKVLTEDLPVQIDSLFSTLTHLLLLPASFYVVKKYGFSKDSLKITLILTFFVLVVSSFLSYYQDIHLNCVSIQADCYIFTNVSHWLIRSILISLVSLIWVSVAFFLFRKLFSSQCLRR